MLRGGLFGLGYFGFGVYWVYYSVYVYAYTPLGIAIFLTMLLVLFLALYPALASWLVARLLPVGALRLIGAATLLALAEWVRAILFTGFPWVLIGQGSLDSMWAGYLPVMGVYGAGLMLLLSAAALAGWLRQPFSHGVTWLGVAALIAGTGVGFRQIEWSTPFGSPVSVSLVQTNLNQDLRWRRDHLPEIKQSYLEMSQQAQPAQLIVWPEAAIPQLLQQIEPFYQQVMQTQPATTTLLAGAFYKESEDARPQTGLINLRTHQRYGKRHLVPFGEYTPFESWLQPLYRHMHIRMRNLQASNDRPLLRVHDVPVGVTICYESIYPQITRMAFPEAAYLVNVSNDAWFGATRAPRQHLEAARVRAAETAREMLRATSTGITAILGADGAVVSEAPQFERAILRGEVRTRRGLTSYVLWGNTFFFGLIGAILIMCAWECKKQRRVQQL